MVWSCSETATTCPWTWRNEFRYGLGGVVVLSQFTKNHGLRAQPSPIPKGYGIETFPHDSSQPGFAGDGAAAGDGKKRKTKSRRRKIISFSNKSFRRDKSRQSEPTSKVGPEADSSGCSLVHRRLVPSTDLKHPRNPSLINQKCGITSLEIIVRVADSRIREIRGVGAEIEGDGSFATVVSVASGESSNVGAANGGAAGEDGGVLSEQGVAATAEQEFVARFGVVERGAGEICAVGDDGVPIRGIIAEIRNGF
nr:hypothetical protein Iba_chr15dCG3020 [Ipomoea batatas]